jgi:hypothetical protein
MATSGEAMPDAGMEVEVVLARFDGDARAALVAALDDVAFLRREIAFARFAMSYGFARGWRPALERPIKEATVDER